MNTFAESGTSPTDSVNRFVPTKVEGIDFFNTRMWDGGPLRQMAATKLSNAFIPYEGGNLPFAGRYVCDNCLKPCQGVMRQNVGSQGNAVYIDRWLCDQCRRTSLKPKQ
jgi:hypothetical protein